jgi:hypothetical protein
MTKIVIAVLKTENKVKNRVLQKRAHNFSIKSSNLSLAENKS